MTGLNAQIEVLRDLLSTKFHVTTSPSSDNERQQIVSLNESQKCFAKIGAGMCGYVFQQTKTDSVLKRPVDKYQAENLRNDHAQHQSIEAAFTRLRETRPDIHIDICIPRVGAYHADDTDGKKWWDENEQKFPPNSMPKEVLVSERIMPLREMIREAWVKRWCEDATKQEALIRNPANADCLCRVYLGGKRPQPFILYGLRNTLLFPDDLDESTAKDYARAMAEVLAVMHWEVKCDARDVEFVLGSPLANENQREDEVICSRRIVQLWMLDFNQVQSISMDEHGVRWAAEAFMDNDPYFPRPLRDDGLASGELWTEFKDTYLARSETLIGEEADLKSLPQGFLDEVVNIQKQRGSKGGR